MPEMLTSVSRVQGWLAPDQGTLVSTNGEMIRRLITAFSALVLNEINRDTLARTERTEVYPGGRTGILLLRNWPVLSVESLGIGTTFTATPSDYSLEPIRPTGCQRIYLSGGRTFVAPPPAGVSVTYTSGYVTTETIVVPEGAAPTFETTLMWLADHGVTDLAGAPVAYTVDSSGTYTPSPALAGTTVLVTHSYVPADIEQVVIDEIAASFKSRQRIGESSKALPQGGGTLYYLPRTLLPISVMALQNYMRVVPI